MATTPRSRSVARDPRALVRAYLAGLPAKTRAALARLRAAIRAAAPGAAEGMGYGILAYRLDGKVLVYCAGWKAHTSLYPVTPAMRRALAADLATYQTSKGTVQFPLTAPVPVTFVRRLVKARVTELRAAARR